MDRKGLWILAAVVSIVFFGFVSAQAQAPNGDYGDAPDGMDAYPGIAGRFPTLYNSTSGLIGGHILKPGGEMIGTEVSAEDDANDPADPDGIQNLVDTDRDDPVYLLIMAVSIPAKARLKFKVTIDDTAPKGKRYINVLFDFDKNGTWGGKQNGKEWAIQNQEIEIAPGSTEWVETDWFNWGSGMIMPTPVWARLAITRKPIDYKDWKGQGAFEYGEIQDFLVELNAGHRKRGGGGGKRKPICGDNVKDAGEQCDGKDDKACPGKCKANCRCPKGPGGGGGGGPRGPGPNEGPCTTPVKYHAIVINAGDNSRRRQAMDSADDIWRMLGEQGYDRGHYLAPHWDDEIGEMSDNGVTAGGYSSLAGIEAAFKKLGNEVKCVDRVMIYIIGHGLRKGGRRYGKTWPSGGIILNGKKGGKEVLTPEKLDELISKYLPACPKEDCKTPEKSCHVSIVIESCHSGNFFDILKGVGRTVAVSSASDEVAFFGKDNNGRWHGGDYTNGYVKDMYDPVHADTDKDGYVSIAEAHASAKAKLSVAKEYKKKQTPKIDSQECECLPLTCGPKCGDGVINGDEECDPKADPTGCPENGVCNQNCECELIETPPEEKECGPDGFFYKTECEASCDGSCIMGDDQCWYCIEEEGCPENQYTPDECEERRKGYQRCVCDEATDCCYLQSICGRGEYISSDCDGECEEGEECVVEDPDVPCYVCGTPTEVCEDMGMYGSQSDCESECEDPDHCAIDESTNCWYCVQWQPEETCADRGMYDSQGECEEECDEPDYCAFHEGYECWYCMNVECGSGLYEDPNCEGECDAGEICEEYQDTGCYRCVQAPCPDLYVSSLSANIHRSASTTCQGEVCETFCELEGEVNFKIRNTGSAASGASSAEVEISPNVGSQTESIPSLNSGQESSTFTTSFYKSGTVSGSGPESCNQLDWWVDSYTATVVADYNNALDECNEDNNAQSVSPQ